MAFALAELQPRHIFGESMHIRGENSRLVEQSLGGSLPSFDGFDRLCSKLFHEELRKAGLRGTWWPA
jgi:hypothetical protein